jgi:glutamate-1-semialdehyde 2,1-aminomutase
LRYGTTSDLYGAEPDLIMLGKIIGGGLPIGAVAGHAAIMDLLAPLGPVYQAGTLSGNPLSVRAGLETLSILATAGTYDRLENSGAYLEAGLREALARHGLPASINRAGSLLTLFLGVDRVTDGASARQSDSAIFSRYFHQMLEHGVYLPPSQFEAMFLSLAHTEAELDATIAAAEAALASA